MHQKRNERKVNKGRGVGGRRGVQENEFVRGTEGGADGKTNAPKADTNSRMQPVANPRHIYHF